MDDEKNILELKFVGNGINPTSIKPVEVAELIVNFEKALLSAIKDSHIEIDTDQLLFSFDAIRNESLDLRFIPRKISEIVISGYILLSTSVRTGDYSNLSNTTINPLKSITKFSKKHNCVGYFNLNGETLSSFTPATEISLHKTILIKGETTVFGKLIDAGGENPNVHIKVNDEYILIFSTSEINAKILAAKLYEKVVLKGQAKWDPETFRIIDFKLNDILEYSSGKTSKALSSLKNLGSGFWDKFNSNDEINNQLLRD